jgi:adenylyltransferase/sulfurtransferase
VEVEPVVADINRTNIEGLCDGADLILDGTDNFEVRYLINDVSIKHGKPWVYGGAVGTEGMSMTVLPGETPCLQCVFEKSPGPGEVGTCETAGVLAPIVSVIASFQAAEALKILAGRREAVNRELFCINLWDNTTRWVKIAKLAGRKGNCPCCAKRNFEWLDGEHGTQTTSLCGRNAVQVTPKGGTKLDLNDLKKQLEASGSVTANRFLLKFSTTDAGNGYEFTVFPDGRAIIKGTDDTDRARTLYAKYVGH